MSTEDLELLIARQQAVIDAAMRRRAKGAPDHPIWREFDQAVAALDPKALPPLLDASHSEEGWRMEVGMRKDGLQPHHSGSVIPPVEYLND